MPKTVGIETVPDWVCEVASPSTTKLDRGVKLKVYGRVRVKHLWLVEPLAQLLEVYRHTEKGWLLAATFTGNKKARIEPFDAIEIELSRLWAEIDD